MTTILCLIFCVLATSEQGEVDFHPSPGEAEVPEVFRLRAERFAFEMQEIRKTESLLVYLVKFPSPVTTADVENNTVHGEYFLPEGQRRPAVIVLHILGADFALSRYMAARLADRGVAALFVKLPYYGERRPAGGAKRFLSTDIERTVLSMRQGVCDVRRAAAWLASRAEVDRTKIGVAGISLGGIVSALAAEADPSISKAALLLAGGGLADILWEMPEGARYRELWIASGRSKADLERLTYPYDPLTYAGRLKSKKLIMFAGNVDDVIPPSSAKALWEAAGRPPIRWFDCGHYSSVGYLLPALRETVEFFAVENGK
jgi:dienelactone hydrolase